MFKKIFLHLNLFRLSNYCLLIFCLLFLNACTTLSQNNTASFTSSKNNKHSSYRVHGKKYVLLKSSRHYDERGLASWYGRGFQRHRTTSGERFNMYKLTAAHRTLPLYSRVLVTNLLNGKKVIVKINDRGPFVSNRLIDLSYAAAKKLGMLGHGTTPVRIKAIS